MKAMWQDTQTRFPIAEQRRLLRPVMRRFLLIAAEACARLDRTTGSAETRWRKLTRSLGPIEPLINLGQLP